MHVGMMGGRIIEAGGAAYIPDPAIVTVVANPVGINFAGDYMSTQDFPIFQDQIRSSRGFTTPASGFASYAAVDSNGWPTEDFGVVLHELGGGTVQSWQTTGTGKFACGFTGVGTVAANNGCTVNNIVITGSGASMTTTFDVLPDANQATYTFKVTSVTPGVGCQYVFAYLPAYRSSQSNVGNVNGYSATSLFTTESVAFYKQFGWLRDMKYKGAWTNAIANTSTTRATPTNTKAMRGGADHLPLEWFIDFLIVLKAAGGNTGIWHCLPVNDDGTYLAADIVSLQRLAVGVPIYLEIGNELWNGTGTAGGALRAISVAVTPDASFTGTISGTTLTVSGVTGALFSGTTCFVYGAGVATGTYLVSGSGTTWTVSVGQAVGPVAMTQGSLFSVYRMVAYLFHTNICPALRTAFGSRYGTDVQTVLATQQGSGNGCFFLDKALSYASSQGWNIPADMHWVSCAPYLNTSGLTPATATIAQIETNLTSGAGYSLANIIHNVGAEQMATQARYWGMNGLIGYEGGWQLNAENSGLVNGGATAVDSGMTAVISGLCSRMLDSGFNGISHFESGAQGNTSNLGCEDHLSNSYQNLITSGSPILSGLQIYMPNTYVPIRNIVSTHGSSFAAYNYVGNFAAPYPNFNVSGLSPPNFIGGNGIITYLVNCTAAGSYSFAIDFTNTSASAANCNVRLNGATVLTGNAVVPGTGTNGGVNTVTLMSLNLPKGFSELTVGPGTLLSTLSMTNLIRFN